MCLPHNFNQNVVIDLPPLLPVQQAAAPLVTYGEIYPRHWEAANQPCKCWDITAGVKLELSVRQNSPFSFPKRRSTSNRLECVISTSERLNHSRDVLPWNQATSNQQFKMLTLLFFANNTHSQPGNVQLVLLNACFDLLCNQATAQTVKRHGSQHRIIFEFGQI